MNKRRLLSLLSVLAVVLGSLFYFGFYGCNSHISLLRVTAETDKLNERIGKFRIIVFSDLKYQGNEEQLDEAVELINSQNPTWSSLPVTSSPKAAFSLQTAKMFRPLRKNSPSSGQPTANLQSWVTLTK